jgi:hypothetical protein
MSSHDKPAPSPSKRKPYRPPALEKYGTIRELTKVIGGTMASNDSAPMNNKTG